MVRMNVLGSFLGDPVSDCIRTCTAGCWLGFLGLTEEMMGLLDEQMRQAGKPAGLSRSLQLSSDFFLLNFFFLHSMSCRQGLLANVLMDPESALGDLVEVEQLHCILLHT